MGAVPSALSLRARRITVALGIGLRCPSESTSTGDVPRRTGIKGASSRASTEMDAMCEMDARGGAHEEGYHGSAVRPTRGQNFSASSIASSLNRLIRSYHSLVVSVRIFDSRCRSRMSDGSRENAEQ